MRPALGSTRPGRRGFGSWSTWRYASVCVDARVGVQCTFIILIPAVCRMMRWPCRGKYALRCFSWRTRWLRSGRSTRCCASSLNRLWLLTSKQVINAVSGNKYLQFHAVIVLQSQYGQRLRLSWLIFSSVQPGPINREMRHLISTLQTHNQQMKGEVVKYKIRLRETQAELNQVGPESQTKQFALNVKQIAYLYIFCLNTQIKSTKTGEKIRTI